jgi:hypothetical protein
VLWKALFNLARSNKTTEWQSNNYIDAADRRVIELLRRGKIESKEVARVLYKIYTHSYLIGDTLKARKICPAEECREEPLVERQQKLTCCLCDRTITLDQFDEQNRNKLSVLIGEALWEKGGIALMEDVAGKFPNQRKAYLLSHSWDRVGGWFA